MSEGRQRRTTAGTSARLATARLRPKPPKRRGRRALRLGLGVAALGVISVLLVCGLFYVRLSHGSVALAGLLPRIEQAISDELGGRAVRIESAELLIGESGALVIGLKQVVVADQDGTPLALAPEALGTVSTSALKRGKFALERIELVAPRVQVLYSDDGRLSLQFNRTSEPATQTTAGPAPAPIEAPASVDTRSIDLIKAITDGSGRARRRETASGYLRTIGLKDAVVVLSHGQRRSVWNVPDLQLDLSHKRTQSLMSGQATIASLTGPWVLGFKTFEVENSDQLQLGLTVQGLNPRGVSRMFPGLAMAERIDLPIDAEAKLILGTTGDVRSATVEARGAQQSDRLAADTGPNQARLSMSYDGSTRQFDISALALAWAGSQATLSGQIIPRPGSAAAGSPQVWSYEFSSASGSVASGTPGAAATRIEQASIRGTIAAADGRITLDELLAKAGGAEIFATGVAGSSGGRADASFNGRLSPMSVGMLKAIWPAGLATQARQWFAGHLAKGQLAGGVFKTSVVGPAPDAGPDAASDTRLSLTLEASGLEVLTAKGLPPLEVPRALIRIEGRSIEVTAPDAVITASEGRKLQFKGARITAVETARGEQPTAEVAFRVLGPLAAVAEIADRDALQLLKSNGIVLPGLDGKIDGQVKFLLPLAENVQLSEMRAEGRVRITELKARQIAGPHDISGGTLSIDLTDKAADIKGDLLIKGVTAKLGWQYLFNQPAVQQAPVRITAILDTADRTALGLDINDIVLGEVPVEVTVGWAEGGQVQTRVRCDLTKAELSFDAIAWKKPPGRAAVFQFDPAKGPGTGAAARIELQQVKIAGDDIAVEGWLAIGADNRLREFSFPEFSVNVVTRLSAHGKLRPDNVWDIKAKGTAFDGRDMFRSLFNLGQTATRLKSKSGLDLAAEIDTVIGFSDTNLRAAVVKASRRDDKLTDLDLRATLDGGKPFAATIRNTPSVGRQLLAEGADAGQVFKLVGFYPNALGGLMQLEVNLDAKGANEKSGTLWAKDFAILGDPVINEVFQNSNQPGDAGAGGKPRQRVVRQKFDFDQLAIPFDVGSGQFVMNAAAIRGPVVGATFRGKIDFKSQVINVGGTYVPLSGLNSALGGILGPLSGGPQGEGLFGITFAVQGPLANPQVIVNPFSLLGPGIFREIFQMAPETFRINPRADSAVVPAAGAAAARSRLKTAPVASPARASSAPAVEQKGAPAARGQPEILSDWSSDVKAAPKKLP